MDITQLTYSTFVTTAGQAPFMTLLISLSGGSAVDDTLTFTPTAASVAANVWQSWVAHTGTWTSATRGGPTTLAAYAAAHPGASVIGGPTSGRPDRLGLYRLEPGQASSAVSIT